MSKSRTKKASPAKDSTTETATAMDPSVREQRIPEIPSTSHRDAYALTVLVNEVTGLFPETTYETSGANAFNTRLTVAFFDGSSDLYPLLMLVETDPRVLAVGRNGADTASVVEFHNSFRTQDSRAPFGLAEAHAILSSGEGDIVLDENHDFVVDDSPEAAELWAENDARLNEPCDAGVGGGATCYLPLGHDGEHAA